MKLTPFQAVYPRMEFITSPEHFFSTVREQFLDYKESGFFTKTSSEGLFIYQIQTTARNYTGFIGCIHIQDFIDGKIKKHENTLAVKEQQQMHLLLKRGAQVKPVLLTYPKVEGLEKLAKKHLAAHKPSLEIEFGNNNEKHCFWAITDGQLIQTIQKLFKEKIPHTYIADGHHRTSTTAIMHERLKGTQDEKSYHQLLCALFPTTELEVLDFNRVVEGFGEISMATFLVKLSNIFDLEVLKKPRKPRKKHEIIMFLDKDWFSLKWRKHILKKERNEPVLLDAKLLNDHVLRDIFEIKDVKTDTRIKYVEAPLGLEGVRQKVLKSEQRVGFLLYPVSMKDFLCIADAGKTLPPKSTWFEPRIKNGMVVKEF